MASCAKAQAAGTAGLEEIFLKLTSSEGVKTWLQRCVTGVPKHERRSRIATPAEPNLAECAQARRMPSGGSSARARARLAVGVVFWSMLFAIIFRMLGYFRRLPGSVTFWR